MAWHGKLTRKADHSVSSRYGANFLLRGCFLAVVPGIWLLLGDLGEFGIQLCGFLVVLGYRLATVRAEAIFEQRVYLDRLAEGVERTEV